MLSFSAVLLRFLYDKSSLEYLYYKRKVAELRKNLLRPENMPDNGKFAFSYTLSFVCVFFVTSIQMLKLF